MQDLVPIMVRIGLAVKGGKQVHDYPDFNSLPPEVRGNRDWSYFVDIYGGWHYDKVTGHRENNPELNSPLGVWMGMLLVPEDFAVAAISAFGTVSRMTEQEAAGFYDLRAHVHEPALKIDKDIIENIKVRRDLGLEDDEHSISAMDENHPSPGVRKNKTKTWEGFKAQRGFSIKEA